MLFRGYPFQRSCARGRSRAARTTSVPFALVHLQNPNVAPASRWRTRCSRASGSASPTGARAASGSHLPPLGLELGAGRLPRLARQRITQLTPTLLRFQDSGPSARRRRLRLEGGAACTLALVLLILFVWRTRLFSADAEIRGYRTAKTRTPILTPCRFAKRKYAVPWRLRRKTSCWVWVTPRL